ncbi:MAG: addiction module protein [Bacteroidota bacterium]|nr:addiction module protein [Bacteroidota bacterium]
MSSEYSEDNLVEDIWDTISEELTSVELTESEKRIINMRLDEHHQNPGLGSPWKDVFKRIIIHGKRNPNLIKREYKKSIQ